MKLQDLIKDRLLISINQFAKVVRVSRPTLIRIVKEGYQPSELIVKKICKYFDEPWKEYIEK